MHYPKVLIIGHSFNEVSGSGVTLLNLFKDWPSEKIAVVSQLIDVNVLESLRPCDRYFELLPQKVSKNPSQKSTHINNKAHTGLNAIKLKLRPFIKKTGLWDLPIGMNVSDELINFIFEYNPDVIYSALGNLRSMIFIEKILERTSYKFPLAIHIWDDWQTTIYKNRYLSHLWGFLYKNHFKRILSKASVFLSISEAMSLEYNYRYKKDFHWFHNPVDLKIFGQSFSKELKHKNSFQIVYLGKINKDTKDSILDMCHVVELSNKEGYNFTFHVYSPDFDSEDGRKIAQYPNCFIYKSRPQAEVPQLLKEADLLFLPLGFSKESIAYTKLSMPTKTSEYMASGTPILVYAPAEIALTKYASEYSWAIVVSIRDRHLLQQGIIQLFQDPELRENLVTTAYDIAKTRHSVEIVRERFRRVFLDNINIK